MPAASSVRLVSGWCLIGREVELGLGIRPSRPDYPDGPVFSCAASAHEARCQPLLPARPSDSHRCQMFRGRKMVAPAPARHERPQVPKLTAQAASCEVPPNWSSVTPNRSVPRKLALKADAAISGRTRFARDSLLEEDGFELLVPVVKRRPPREMESGLCRTGPHFH